jgi:NhaP-type Na+/H+ and K+/H+ antiporter
MLAFMLFCLILGLWIKPRVRSGIAIMAAAALLLALYFFIRPFQL